MALRCCDVLGSLNVMTEMDLRVAEHLGFLAKLLYYGVTILAGQRNGNAKTADNTKGQNDIHQRERVKGDRGLP
jgi:hypothetical protein